MCEFHPDVAADRLALDLADWREVYVVGDVHGCRRALDRLLARLDVGPADLVVFVGDLVGEGPESAAVVERVRKRPNYYAVRGNMEEAVLRGTATVPGLDDAHVEWLRSLPVAVTWAGGLVVHGGVDPRRPLAEQTVADPQTTRSLVAGGGYQAPYWYERYAGPPRVYFGHTVLEAPVERRWAVSLDTGCVYGGRLTAYDVREERFRDVPARGSGLDRSDGAIVSPESAPGTEG